MTSTSSGARKPKPTLPIRQVLADVDADDEALREGIEWVASASHAQRATFAAVSETDGISAQRAGGVIPWSASSARAAIEAMSDEGLAETDDGWPALATLTETGERVIEALREGGVDLVDAYLHDEDDGEDDGEDEEQATETVEAGEGEPEDEGVEESHSDGSATPSPHSSLDAIAQQLASGGDFTRSAPKQERSQGSTSGSRGTQSWPERPAASWDEADGAGADGLGSDDVIAETLIELASEMGSKASQDAMSNLNRENARALQASAFADLVRALVALRESTADETDSAGKAD